MKTIIFLFIWLVTFTTFGQKPKVEFDGKNWQPPYNLTIPQGWDVERFQIPIVFAPQILYTGVEDVRFTPGWGKVKSNEYWTYAYLWYLDGFAKMDKKIIRDNLKAYYTGLVRQNSQPKKIPADKAIPIQVEIKKIKATNGDLQTFTGSIEMLDYMEQKPITLRCIIHIKQEKERNKTFVFYELSPKPFTDDIWLGLHQLWTDFDNK